jgi:hypothetical protein
MLDVDVPVRKILDTGATGKQTSSMKTSPRLLTALAFVIVGPLALADTLWDKRRANPRRTNQ